MERKPLLIMQNFYEATKKRNVISFVLLHIPFFIAFPEIGVQSLLRAEYVPVP